MVFRNKTVVVTGAGGGLGRQLVLQLVAESACVAAADINPDALERTRSEAKEREKVTIHRVDITEKAAVIRLAQDVQRIHGKADGLIDNAGIIQESSTILGMPDSSVDRLKRINFHGMLNVTKAYTARRRRQ